MKKVVDHRDTLYTIDKRGNRKWVYAHYLPGRYLRYRTVVGWFLVAFYLSLPWLTIGGKQGVLLDFPRGRFIFFGLELWATDTIFLFYFLAILGMCLFFFTAVLGRVWCGWACPETVFLEFIFRPIERFIEGSDAERRKLDAAPWTLDKIIKKGIKHALCACLAWIIASTALAYFIGREPLLTMMTHSPLENMGPFVMTVLLMGLMAFRFGWFREQFCTVLCPYARFQSVLMDQSSLLVGYDARRGEPRGKARQAGHGDCIDCGLCVKVCPTGIDIRNGTQLECIACANCADACDSVMAKINRPTGLVRYTTEAALQGKPTRWIRPRLFAYALALTVLLSLFGYKLATRQSFDAEIVRVSKAGTFEQIDGDIVTNQFSLRVANKGHESKRFELHAIGAHDIELVSPLAGLELKPGDAQQVPLFVRAPKSSFHAGSRVLEIEVVTDDANIRRALTLIGPEK